MVRDTDRSGCLTLLLGLIGIKLQGVGSAAEVLPYRLRDDFLSPAERSFFGVLKSVIGERAVLFAKVRVSDLLYVPRSKGSFSHQNRINAKHVDFVLCHPDSLRPMAAVELDDDSHNRQDRVNRDEFLDAAFASADLPLLRFVARRQYDLGQIAGRIDPVLNQSTSVTVASSVVKTAAPPNCPKCDSPMVLRSASSGPKKGESFYGCSNYPQCRGIVSVESPR